MGLISLFRYFISIQIIPAVFNLPGLLHRRFNMETGHPCYVSRCVQEVLFCTLAV